MNTGEQVGISIFAGFFLFVLLVLSYQAYKNRRPR